ncbi:hypothetical protein F511_01195 [Dorcoceras hygrometricum]|uniref:GST N-terminal domain-containing protein n=1 Tax=Dorcoceras hygrometricum TaxID=472368 RepID=A0A2Z7BYK7_9LAMI|nr:hypothetical protein F511_01195 [Dorcoceras hygrometricum]
MLTAAAAALQPVFCRSFVRCSKYSQRVREAITELDLSVEIFPCPKGSIRHREMVRKLGSREQFPFLVDPNTGISMYESRWLPTLLRAGRGMTLWKNSAKEPPPEKLELYSFENNPYARIVREVLCELELPYILQSVGQGSGRAKLLLELSGSYKVPYLVDPNTGMESGQYKKIIAYLVQTYSIATT